jgi:alpha,alpha-trehalose phosphorylase
MVTFAPRLPEGINRLEFTLLVRGRRLRVRVTHDSARYQLLDGEPLDITHHGEKLTLAGTHAQERRISRLPSRPRPTQPAGRSPARRLTMPGDE